ncbi:MAG: sigma 54-interacting transcriptional regulator [Candidatus Sedimenticola endophacoides]
MLSHLIHRAEVYQEQQLVRRGIMRPLELFRSLAGNSAAIRRINKMVAQVADTEAAVLILGESGTGKEVVARKLHYSVVTAAIQPRLRLSGTNRLRFALHGG